MKLVFVVLFSLYSFAMAQSITGYAFKKNHEKVNITHLGGITEAHADDTELMYVTAGFYLGESSLSDMYGIIGVDRHGNVKRSLNWGGTNHFRNIKVVQNGGYITSTDDRVIRFESGSIIGEFKILWEKQELSSGEYTTINIANDNHFILSYKADDNYVKKLNSIGDDDPNFGRDGEICIGSRTYGSVNCIFQNNSNNLIAVLGGSPSNINDVDKIKYHQTVDFKVVDILSDGRIYDVYGFTDESGNPFMGGGSFGMQTSDGGYIFTGCSSNKRAFLIKTNSLFETVFVKEYSSENFLTGIGVSEDADHNYILTGMGYNSEGNRDFFMATIDQIGNVADGSIKYFPDTYSQEEGSC